MSTVRHVSESALQRAVGAEANARANAVSAETRRAKSAEDALGEALGNKVDKVAGKGLSESDFTPAEKTKLEGIETGAQVNPLPIGPSAATEEGEFADAKLTLDLINEAASTNSAHYLTADADGTPFATAANLRSALASHTEVDPKFFYAGAAFTPTKNDWVVVQVDEEHPLGIIVPSSRWGFVGVFGSGGSFQYQVSYRLPLTPEQIAAMNSGATAQKIARYDGHCSSQDNPHNVTALQVGADVAGTAAGVVAAHNADTTAHAGLFAAKRGKTDYVVTTATPWVHSGTTTTADPQPEYVNGRWTWFSGSYGFYYGYGSAYDTEITLVNDTFELYPLYKGFTRTAADDTLVFASALDAVDRRLTAEDNRLESDKRDKTDLAIAEREWWHSDSPLTPTGQPSWNSADIRWNWGDYHTADEGKTAREADFGYRNDDDKWVVAFHAVRYYPADEIARKSYVDDKIGDINDALDELNGEVA